MYSLQSIKTKTKNTDGIHHLRSGQGMSQRGVKCIPLCVEHHRGDTGFHGLGRKGFEQLHNISEDELLQAWQSQSDIHVDWDKF